MIAISPVAACFFRVLCAMLFKSILSLEPIPCISIIEGVSMPRLTRLRQANYVVDLDPTHNVIRLTVTAKIMTVEMAEDCHALLKRISSSGDPYAAIYDLSAVIETTIPTEWIRSYARRDPPVPMVRPHVVVGTTPVIYGLGRLFQMSGESWGHQCEVVYTLQEAYDIVEVRPEDFTERLFPKEMAA